MLASVLLGVLSQQPVAFPDSSVGSTILRVAHDGDYYIASVNFLQNFTAIGSLRNSSGYNVTLPMTAASGPPRGVDIKGDVAAVVGGFSGINSDYITFVRYDGTAWITEGSYQSALQPESVSIDASGLVVVGDKQSGSCLIFERDAAATWALVDTLGPFGVGVEDVCIHEGSIAVLTSTETRYFESDQSGSWVQSQELPLGGEAVTLNADYLCVGSSLSLGQVSIFERSLGSWALVDTITGPANLPDGWTTSGFGVDVDLHGEKLAVAASSGPGQLIDLSGAQRTELRCWYQYDQNTPGVSIDQDRLLTTCNGRLRIHSLDGGLPVLFCQGDGGDQLGCTDCPCGNEAVHGALGGCSTAPNRGFGGLLSATGRLSASEDTLELSVANAEGLSFAILLSGANALPMPGAGCPQGAGIITPNFPLNGLRCIGGGGLQRHGVLATDLAGDTIGVWSDLIASGSFIAGQVQNFQCFYRQPLDVLCGTGQNTTNAVRAVVLP